MFLPILPATFCRQSALIPNLLLLASVVFLHSCGNSGNDDNTPVEDLSGVASESLLREAADGVNLMLSDKHGGDWFCAYTRQVDEGFNDWRVGYYYYYMSVDCNDAGASFNGTLLSALVNQMLAIDENYSADLQRDGNRITIDPDELSICRNGDNLGFVDSAACNSLLGDFLVQINAINETTGSAILLYEYEPVMEFGYGYGREHDYTDIHAKGLSKLTIATAEIDPTVSLSRHFMEFSRGILRWTSTLEQQRDQGVPGTMEGRLVLEIVEALKGEARDTGYSMSLDTGEIFSLDVDGDTGEGELKVDIGKLALIKTESGKVSKLDLDGLTGTIDVSASADKLSFSNLGLGMGGLSISVNSVEKLSLIMESLGFELTNDFHDGSNWKLAGVVTTRALNMTAMFDSSLEHDLLGKIIGEAIVYGANLSAPVGTRLIDHESHKFKVIEGGPVILTTQENNGNSVVDESMEIPNGWCFGDDETGKDAAVVCE